jgi:hypothetical protein
MIELTGLLIVIAAGWRFLGQTNVLEVVPAPEISVPAALLQGGVLAFYAFIGFEDMVNVAEEVRDARRVLPWAILTALTIASSLYILITIIAVSAVPYRELAASGRAAHGGGREGLSEHSAAVFFGNRGLRRGEHGAPEFCDGFPGPVRHVLAGSPAGILIQSARGDRDPAALYPAGGRAGPAAGRDRQLHGPRPVDQCHLAVGVPAAEPGPFGAQAQDRQKPGDVHRSMDRAGPGRRQLRRAAALRQTRRLLDRRHRARGHGPAHVDRAVPFRSRRVRASVRLTLLFVGVDWLSARL